MLFIPRNANQIIRGFLYRLVSTAFSAIKACSRQSEGGVNKTRCDREGEGVVFGAGVP